MTQLGAGEILLTSMDRDGAKTGFDLALTRAVTDAVDVPVIASGGVGKLQDLVDGVVIGGADAVLAASIFHYGEFTLGQAKQASYTKRGFRRAEFIRPATVQESLRANEFAPTTLCQAVREAGPND